MAQPKQQYSKAEEEQLMASIWSPQIADDPYAFVMFAFPWGVPGTPLEHVKGPRTWQTRWLKKLAHHIAKNKQRIVDGKVPEMFNGAMSSGRGIGKSALVAMLTLWLMSTRLGGTVVVTANNETQLKSRTWAELGTWHTLSINSHWFEKQTMSLKPAPWFEELLKRELKIDTGYYYAQAQLWSEETPDAFAGIHNPKGIMVIFDEASGIPATIWTVSAGFFTEKSLHRYWLVFSNPRRNTGAFFECFHRQRDSWDHENIDARTVEENDQEVYARIIATHGVDSDEARVEVYGQFPRQGDKQFINREVIVEAATRPVVPDSGAPLIMGCDIARYGDDECVIRFRQGRDARTIPALRWKSMDLTYTANRIAEAITKHKPDAVMVDGGGVGGGAVDILKALGYRVHEVQFGGKSTDTRWANKRTELWADMRDWLPTGSIDDRQQLLDDLAGPEYGFQAKSDLILLETKEKMKSRGLHSPDDGDALAMTFAVQVARKDLQASRHRRVRTETQDQEYDLFK